MTGGRLFGDRPVGVISVVDAPVSRSFAHRARLAFFTAGPVFAVLASAVLAVSHALPLAILLGVLAGLVLGFASAVLVMVWPVLRVLWWWALELVTAGLLLWAWSGLAGLAGPWWAALLLLVTAAGLLLVRWVRRWVSAWSWCVVVRHRVRHSFAQFVKSSSRSQLGTLPLVLWARPTPAGERLWVWLRPGLDLSDLDGKQSKFAVACWASEVRMARASARVAALLRVDVTRRDPLVGDVLSPLAALFQRDPDSDSDPELRLETGPEPLVGLDLEDVPAPVDEPAPRGRR